jgi:hypothetical protein
MGGVVKAVGSLFGGGESPATPATPDYRGAAQETAASNKEAATANTWANRPTINTPWGTQSWDAAASIDPSTGKPVTSWTQNTKLTGAGQRALDSQMQMQQGRSDLANSFMDNVRQNYSQPVDYNSMQAWGKGYQGPAANTSYQGSAMNNSGRMQTSGINGSGMYQPVANSIFNQAASRLDPRFQQAQGDLDAKLAAQGISRNSRAFNRAQNNLSMQRNDAYNTAMNTATTSGIDAARSMQGMDIAQMNAQNTALQTQQQMDQSAGAFKNAAVTAGNQAQNQNFDQSMRMANYSNSLRQAQTAEALQRRSQSLNDMNAVVSGQQVSMPTMPGFQNATQYGGTNYFGAAQAQAGFNQDQANAQNAQRGNDQAGAFGLLGTGLQAASMFGFSDRRLKKNIRKVGTMHKGRVNVYEFEYLGSDKREIGVMADEVKKTHPEAVKRHESGYLMVNYSKLLGA